jgi:hypothetical protein
VPALLRLIRSPVDTHPHDGRPGDGVELLYDQVYSLRPVSGPQVDHTGVLDTQALDLSFLFPRNRLGTAFTGARLHHIKFGILRGRSGTAGTNTTTIIVMTQTAALLNFSSIIAFLSATRTDDGRSPFSDYFLTISTSLSQGGPTDDGLPVSGRGEARELTLVVACEYKSAQPVTRARLPTVERRSAGSALSTCTPP